MIMPVLEISCLFFLSVKRNIICVVQICYFFLNVLTPFREIFDLHILGVYKDLLTALQQKNQMFVFPAPLDGVITV